MGYYNAIYGDIRELSDKETFAFLIETLTDYSKGNKHRAAGEEIRPYWFEIMEFMVYRYQKCGEYHRDFPKFFYQKEHLQILDNMGIDYNYIDQSGKNFFLYYLYSKNNPTYNKDFTFNDTLEEEILNRTANAYLIDKSGQNALFYKTTILAGGIDASDFITFHQKLPELDIHLVNDKGDNLFYLAANSCNIALCNHLIEQNISINHTNQKNQTVLFPFVFHSAIGDTRKLFKELVQTVDISQKNDKDETVLDIWFSWGDIDSKLAKETRLKSLEWIDLFSQCVNNHAIYITPNSSKILLEVMNKHKKNYLKSCEQASKNDYILHFKKAFSTIQYQLFNELMPQASDNEFHDSVAKIKI